MKTLLLFFLFAPLLLWAKPEIIKPKVKTPTSFAIVVDKQSYDRVKSSIEAYRDAIERDGLATYILVDEWENPDAIREILKKLYADKKMPLEGVALVGDVPVLLLKWIRNVPGSSPVFHLTVIMTTLICNLIF